MFDKLIEWFVFALIFVPMVLGWFSLWAILGTTLPYSIFSWPFYCGATLLGIMSMGFVSSMYGKELARIEKCQ